LEGYDYVIAAIKTMTPAQLNEHIKLFGRFDLTKEMVLQKALNIKRTKEDNLPFIFVWQV
jgi:hypothetical protein